MYKVNCSSMSAYIEYLLYVYIISYVLVPGVPSVVQVK